MDYRQGAGSDEVVSAGSSRTWCHVVPQTAVVSGVMKRCLVVLFLLAATCLASSVASATVLRYALIVGANHGENSLHTVRPQLRHAEREARAVRDALVARSGFVQGERTRLLLGPNRADLLAAIRGFRRVIEHDRVLFPNSDAMFLLYYSGHGENQSILVNDGPVTAEELVRALDAVGADLQIRIFDACASASLDTLEAKGMTPLESFDFVKDLPDQRLNSSGEIWLFSSGADERAYEDPQLGGLFTHAFLEALDHAPATDGFGISLDSIWDYTRRRTSDLASKQRHVQTPTRVTRTRSTAALHFAWLPQRPATLILGPELSGSLGISYGGDQLLAFEKSAGTTIERTVYAGTIDVVVSKGGDQQIIQRLELLPGDRVHVARADEASFWLPFGRGLAPVAKGGGDVSVSTSLAGTAEIERDVWTAFLGIGYQRLGSSDVVMTPEDAVSASIRLDYGPWMMRPSLAYAFGSGAFDTWSYRSDALIGKVELGYGFDIGRLRVSPVAALSLGEVWQRFGDGASRRARTMSLLGGVAVAAQLFRSLAIEVNVSTGGRESRGLAAHSSYRWLVAYDVAVGLSVGL